jgi:hypothetical protein
MEPRQPVRRNRLGRGARRHWFIAAPDRAERAINDCMTTRPAHHPVPRCVSACCPAAVLTSAREAVAAQTTLMASSTSLTQRCRRVPATGGCTEAVAARHFYFTGRSDNFGAGLSTNSSNAHDPESSTPVERRQKHLRVGRARPPSTASTASGLRTAVYTLPDTLAVSFLSSRETWRSTITTRSGACGQGTEGLAIT